MSGGGNNPHKLSAADVGSDAFSGGGMANGASGAAVSVIFTLPAKSELGFTEDATFVFALSVPFFIVAYNLGVFEWLVQLIKSYWSAI